MSYLKQYCQYIKNTAQRPLPTEAFDDDLEPIGPMVRDQMLKEELIVISDGGIFLTEKGGAL